MSEPLPPQAALDFLPATYTFDIQLTDFSVLWLVNRCASIARYAP